MTADSAIARLFSELVDGSPERGGAFILSSGDIGLLRSLHKIRQIDKDTRGPKEGTFS